MIRTTRCRLAHLTWLVACLLHLQAATAILVEQRVLFMTTNDTTNIEFMKTTLTAYGIPFDVMQFPNSLSAMPDSYLYKFSTSSSSGSGSGNGNGNGGDKGSGSGKGKGNSNSNSTVVIGGRYSGIIMYPSVDALGFLNSTQVRQIEGYCNSTGARVVRFNAWPTSFGYGVVPSADCTSAEQNMTWTNDVPKGISGVNTTTKLSANGLYRCPGLLPVSFQTCGIWASDFAANGISSACNSTPILTLDANSADGTYSQNTAAGTLVKYSDGREAMVFFMDCAVWQSSCMVISHVVVSWLMHDIIPGERRAMLSTQVDDVFLSTALYNDAVPQYRLTVTDLVAHGDWAGQLNTRLPKGSDYVTELVYNGNGVLAAYNDPATLVMPAYYCGNDPLYTSLKCSCATKTQKQCADPEPWCKNCTKDWRMPLGSGVNRIPPSYSAQSWDPANIRSKDPVANELYNNWALRNSFYWVSHTFHHQNLDNVTYNDALKQWGLNINMTNILNLTASAGLSTKVVVTPQISGLVNGNALKATRQAGFRAVMGDNTWPHLRNPLNPYHTLISTTADNGYSGMRILPRWATEIYFNVAFKKGEEALYNAMYNSYYGASSLDQILTREAERVVRNGLLALRRDPHMFHQANMAVPAGGKSLLMQWVEAVVARYSSFVNWPLETLMADDLMWSYIEREDRDACNLTYAVDVNMTTRTVKAVTVTSNSTAQISCTAPLMLPAAASITGDGLAPGAVASPGIKSLKGSLFSASAVTYATSQLQW